MRVPVIAAGLALTLACVAQMSCSPTPMPSPTPDPTSGLRTYLRGARTFADLHSVTLARLNSTLSRLASEGASKASMRAGSLSELLNVNLAGPSSDEIINQIMALRQLSQEEQAVLARDLASLEELLGRVKRDQIELIRTVPPTGVPTKFHEMAMAAIDLETDALVSLIGFYASPALKERGPTFEQFPDMFASAQGKLTLAGSKWASAVLYLRVMEVDLNTIRAGDPASLTPVPTRASTPGPSGVTAAEFTGTEDTLTPRFKVKSSPWELQWKTSADKISVWLAHHQTGETTRKLVETTQREGKWPILDAKGTFRLVVRVRPADNPWEVKVVD